MFLAINGLKVVFMRNAKNKKNNNLAKLIYEAGQLKRVARTGWWAAGIKFPESVAEHSWRAAVIGYFLGKKAGVNAERVAIMCLFHDLPEARVNDTHKIQQRYFDPRPAEEKAFEEQTETLPKEVKDDLRMLVKECEEKIGEEGMLAKDADMLECAFQAREYELDGFQATGEWTDRIGKLLRTKEGKELFREMLKTSPSEWWHGLKKPVEEDI